METIIAAFIGGLFTLASIFLNHYLALKREVKKYHQTVAPDTIPSDQISDAEKNLEHRSKALAEQHSISDIRIGLSLLIIDFLILTIVVNFFDLNETEPVWENIFAFVAIGAVPVYALYRIVKGVIMKRIRRSV